MRPFSPPLRIAIGLAACIAIAIAARWLATLAGVGIETALALILGLMVGSVPRVRPVTLAGARVAGRSALRIGVALLGARLTLGAVIAGGLSAVIGAAIIVVVGLALGVALARRMGVPPRLGWLVAAGMAICGNSAILALSPSRPSSAPRSARRPTRSRRSPSLVWRASSSCRSSAICWV